ncbi:thialysine N-epsilon-acetyltransferase-like [Aricia agestis]|uniref:thialysine N-epsilon-acetyltransferase-like n=1 Tax=Aricia agestis TaxID=91739 RepID=UPI001C2028E5|nr:thialysine N-epsilon-acetyltransferase-like [Aricia agestis]
MSAGNVVIRDMTRADVPVVHQMIKELAAYEGVPDGPRLSQEDLIRDGFETSPPWYFGLIGELNGEVVGYALCNRAYSSWTCRALYIEDLYVRPAARGAGVARLILQRLCQLAVKQNVHRVDWHVLVNNSLALGFYRRLGAKDLCVVEERTAMRLPRDRIEAVARGELLPREQ